MNEPRTCPNSIDSASSAGIATQFTGMNGRLGARAAAVDCPGDELLAGAAFAGDQDIGSGEVVKPGDLRQDGAHEAAATDQSRDPPAVHVLLREGHQPLRRRVPRRFRGLPPADLEFELLVSRQHLAREPRDLQVRLDPHQHLLRLERLGYVIDPAAAESTQQPLRFVLGGDEEHGNPPCRRLFLERAADGEAVRPWQDDVQQNQIRKGLRGDPQPLLGVRGGENLVSSRLEHAGQQVNVGGRVVDDQNLFGGHGGDPAADATESCATIR